MLFGVLRPRSPVGQVMPPAMNTFASQRLNTAETEIFHSLATAP
jgi:hypothetical protein